jgi:hypothetical protein
VAAGAVAGPAALSREQVAIRLQQVQRQRARLAAEEAGLVLRLAELTPDAHDRAPGTSGARKEGGWASGAELPGVSEFFPAELSMVLNCGRGTAAWRARRAWVWITRLPATFAALKRGEIDERRAQELFDALQHADPDLARRVDAAVLPAATSLTLGALRRRAWSCCSNSTRTSPMRTGRRRSRTPTCSSHRAPTGWPPWAPTCRPMRPRRPTA